MDLPTSPETAENTSVAEAGTSPVVAEAGTLPVVEAPAPVSMRMFVAYVVHTSMGPRFSHTIINGMPDIFSAADVESVTNVLAKQSGAESVTLINWKHLYA